MGRVVVVVGKWLSNAITVELSPLVQAAFEQQKEASAAASEAGERAWDAAAAASRVAESMRRDAEAAELEHRQQVGTCTSITEINLVTCAFRVPIINREGMQVP